MRYYVMQEQHIHYEIDHTEKVDESPTKTSTVEEVRKWKRVDK